MTMISKSMTLMLLNVIKLCHDDELPSSAFVQTFSNVTTPPLAELLGSNNLDLVKLVIVLRLKT